MKTVTLAFENKEIKEKILWFLDHFKDDVKIIYEDDVANSVEISRVLHRKESYK